MIRGTFANSGASPRAPRGIDARAAIVRLFALTLLIVGCCAANGSACEVPVFRYALERWEADRYEAVVLHKGPLDESLRERITVLNGADTSANLDVTLVDVDESLEPELAELWSTFRDENAVSGVWLMIRGPRLAEVRNVVWSGRLDAYDPQQIIASPAREELISRLLSGDSAVWLVVAGENDAAADDVCELLSAELERLGDELPLPEGIGQPGSEVYSPIPLTLRFSVLRVNAADPREKWLVESLRQTAGVTADDGPLVVPVFGRGRALEFIPAPDVNATVAKDLSTYLSGACSCQVKEQNPGVDLLLAVDWDKQLFEEEYTPSSDAPLQSHTAGESTFAAVPLGVIDEFAGDRVSTALPPVEGAASGQPLESTAATQPAAASSIVAGNNGPGVGGALIVALLIAGLFVLLTFLGSVRR